MLQQKGAIVWQEQCFCWSHYPKPFLDQSKARQAGFILSEMMIPFFISCIITDFDSLNNSSRWFLHIKGVLGCSRCWNGWSFSDEAKAYDTWLMRPNQDLMLWMFLGVINPVITSRNLTWFDIIFSYFESWKGDCILSKLKFLWMEGYVVTST